MHIVRSMDRQKEFVLRTLEERDIRFVRLWFTDVLGTLKSVAIAPAELDGAFEEGIGLLPADRSIACRAHRISLRMQHGLSQRDLYRASLRGADHRS